MPEDTNLVENNATQGAPADAERKFTQAELDAIVGDRLKRERMATAKKYADYDELMQKAKAYDEAEEASKSELQKAVEERDRYKAEVDKLQAERERAEQVARIATETGVPAALLSRMSGDIEEAAKALKAELDAQPKYESVHDAGEAKAPAVKEIPIIF